MIDWYVQGLQNCAAWIHEHADEIMRSYDNTSAVTIKIEPGSIPRVEIVHDVQVINRKEITWQPKETT